MTALSCGAAWMAKRQPGRRQAYWALISVLPLFLVSALRWNIGTDYSFSYAPEYDALKWLLAGSDPGSVGLLNSVANASIHHGNAFHATWLFRALEQGLIALGADVQWLFVVCSAVIVGAVCVAVWRQSGNPALALFLFVFSSNYFLSLNIMRQYMAVALCLCALEPAQKRNLPLFLLLVGLGALLHPTALVMLPLYWLGRVRILPVWSLVLIAVALLCAPVARWVLERLVPVVLPKYMWYFDSQFDAGEFEWLFLLVNVAVLTLASWYYRAGDERPYFRLWYNANLIGTLLLCFSGVVPLMKRLNYYFAACHFLLLPLVLSLETNQRRRRILTALVCLAFLAETAVAVVMLGKNGVYPYTSIFDKAFVPYFDWAALIP